MPNWTAPRRTSKAIFLAQRGQVGFEMSLNFLSASWSCLTLDGGCRVVACLLEPGQCPGHVLGGHTKDFVEALAEPGLFSAIHAPFLEKVYVLNLPDEGGGTRDDF